MNADLFASAACKDWEKAVVCHCPGKYNHLAYDRGILSVNGCCILLNIICSNLTFVEVKLKTFSQKPSG